MNTYLALFIVATCASLVLTPVVRRFCERRGWLDEPRDDRRVHSKPIPRLGGVAIFGAVFIALATLPFIDNLITQSLRAGRMQLVVAIMPAAFMFIFGVYDDLHGADVRSKFIAQGLAATLLYAAGGRIEALSVPFVGWIALPPVIGFIFTIVWTVGITNAFNLLDGMDGLAAGAALFSTVVMLVVSLLLNHPLVTVISLALAGALVGFLRYNFNPASIFLGDSGSLFVGFTLAALSVQGTQKASTAIAVAIPLMAFGLPVIDTGFTLVRRFISGNSLFEGDREHIHHMLLARGWSQRRVAFVLYGVCALFALLAMLFVSGTEHTTALVLFIVGVAVVLAMGRLRYHEVDELKASMKRNLADRRLRAANNIRVRRAIHAMSKAATLGALFEALLEMLESDEFAWATVKLFTNGDALRCEQWLAREKRARSLRTANLNGGMICWRWERGDVDVDRLIGSRRFWRLSFPLSTTRGEVGQINLYRELKSEALQLDINYLSTLFQREMSQAIERAMNTGEQEMRESDLSVATATGK